MSTRSMLKTSLRRVDAPPAPPAPTLWGLAPVQLHDAFWSARGTCVVRQGTSAPVDGHAELYLLTDCRTLAIFRVGGLLDVLSWVKPDLMVVRLRNVREQRYRELVVADSRDGFIRFKRNYAEFDSRLARVAVVRSAEVARLWRDAPDLRTAWRRVRRRVGPLRREHRTVTGRTYDQSLDAETAQFVRDLVQCWHQPGTAIPRVRRLRPGVWGYADGIRGDRLRAGGGGGGAGADVTGNVWVGAGRRLDERPGVLGPAVLWDDPAARPAAERLEWDDMPPADRQLAAPRAAAAASRPAYRVLKRGFDVAFAAAALIATAPLFPVVMLAIWLEDGRPFFFAHRRETLGGRTFPCLKFRSMRNDAEQVKAELQRENQADGPQFFMERDPRLTRVGRLIRKLNVDELPQFLNVLVGHMSVVGPRPSPRRENQCCPAWREARLSVRPGITGLWQVMRTRQPGLDFQEWIRFDLEYVERAGWALDLRIIVRTVVLILRGAI